MRRVFLSFSYADLAFAEQLSKALQARRVQVLSKNTLRAGEPFWGGVRDSIESAHRVVLLVSPQAADDSQLFFEAGVAAAARRPLVTVRLPGTPAAKRIRQIEGAADAAAGLDGTEARHDDLATRIVALVDADRPRRTWWRRLLRAPAPGQDR